MTAPPVCVGIDVSKDRLDVARRPTYDRWAVVHEEAGIAALVTRLRHHAPTLIVLEATGGLEISLTSERAAAGLPVVVVNPRQVRDFAKATGRLAKTDTLDARVLAQFAEAVRPPRGHSRMRRRRRSARSSRAVASLSRCARPSRTA